MLTDPNLYLLPDPNLYLAPVPSMSSMTVIWGGDTIDLATWECGLTVTSGTSYTGKTVIVNNQVHTITNYDNTTLTVKEPLELGTFIISNPDWATQT